ncbi:MAG: 4-phosphoerythronate dehydrogenase [Muribaculaceae bacterium]|nr:4-phosphoerythronate dehydrogenase [Muribaculaceae bacterium]
MKKPRLIIESHVPCVPDALGEYFDIERLAPEDITPVAVAGADAMIVRTRTRCDAALLSGSSVRFIATATIGTDHIDRQWCESHGVTVVSAPGCNAPAVAQYVLASLLSLFPEGLEGKTLGVVGVGHVGSIVADWARQLGMKVLTNDPPRAVREADFDNTPLQDLISEADIITFHVPHTVAGAYPTHHIADASMFSRMRDGAVVVNSARGPIVETEALIAALESGKISHAVIDCWEGEPEISQRLLELATVATPHIAGYSLNGKIRATMMVVNALCEFFGVGYRMTSDIPAGAVACVSAEAVRRSYNPLTDTGLLREGVGKSDFAAHFERLRNKYALRPEVGQE